VTTVHRIPTEHAGWIVAAVDRDGTLTGRAYPTYDLAGIAYRSVQRLINGGWTAHTLRDLAAAFDTVTSAAHEEAPSCS
jgi:hypothetical protein